MSSRRAIDRQAAGSTTGNGGNPPAAGRRLTWVPPASARRLAVTGITGYLLFFHLKLLADRVAEQTLLEPVVAIQWIAGLLLSLLFIKFLRAGVPLLQGRRALAFWLLVLILHAGIGGPSTDGAVTIDPAGSSLSRDLLVVLPIGLTIAALVQIGFGLLERRRGPRQRAPALPLFWRRLDPVPSLAITRALLRPLAPRSPPA